MSGDVWSFGGGVQSVAIGILIARGELPKPDAAVIADTGRETRATWEYLDQIMGPQLAEIGLPIQRIGHEEARVDLYDPKGRLLIPAFADTGTPGGGRLPTYCSAEWKRDPIARWLRAQGWGPKHPARVWLGISTDELGRAKQSRRGWIDHHFPLLFDHPMSRADCLLLVEREGLPRPPRSACWMCPHRSDAEWRILKEERPDEWEQAIAFEDELRDREGQRHLFLHRSMAPLADAPIAEQGPGLWDQEGCETGYCFV